jgi:predicted transcriptional regulator
MRDKTINFRVSPYEREILERLAEIENRSASELLREIIRNEYRRRQRQLRALYRGGHDENTN